MALFIHSSFLLKRVRNGQEFAEICVEIFAEIFAEIFVEIFAEIFGGAGLTEPGSTEPEKIFGRDGSTEPDERRTRRTTNQTNERTNEQTKKKSQLFRSAIKIHHN